SRIPNSKFLIPNSSGGSSSPEEHDAGHQRAEQQGDEDDGAGQAERTDQHAGELRQAALVGRWRDDLDDDRVGILNQNVSNASAASVRTATPLGPFGWYGLASSAHAVPAISRC